MSKLTGLISYWGLADNSNDPHGSNNGTDSNMTRSGGYANFNGVNSEINIPDNASLSTGDIDFTIVIRVKLTNKTHNDFGNAIVGKWKYTTSNREYLLWYFDSTDRIRFDVSRNGTNTNFVGADSFGSPPLNTEMLIIAWHDSVNDTLNIQIDNGPVNVQSYTLGVFDGNSNFTFGSYDGNGYYNGAAKECYLYKRILTAQERTDFYNGAIYPFSSNSSGFFQMFQNQFLS